MNFLTALALIDSGVREILPFIRYISQYIDFEFNSIRGQDKGKGVVCAATWYVNSLSIFRNSLTKTLFSLCQDSSCSFGNVANSGYLYIVFADNLNFTGTTTLGFPDATHPHHKAIG